MYNTQKIKDLLEERKLRSKDLLEYLGKNPGNGSLKQLLSGDMKASNVEKIADFFGLSIDYFFDREVTNNGIMINGRGNQVNHNTINPMFNEISNLQSLVEEKDKRIKILEEMIELLKARIPS